MVSGQKAKHLGPSCANMENTLKSDDTHTQATHIYLISYDMTTVDSAVGVPPSLMHTTEDDQTKNKHSRNIRSSTKQVASHHCNQTHLKSRATYFGQRSITLHPKRLPRMGRGPLNTEGARGKFVFNTHLRICIIASGLPRVRCQCPAREKKQIMQTSSRCNYQD